MIITYNNRRIGQKVSVECMETGETGEGERGEPVLKIENDGLLYLDTGKISYGDDDMEVRLCDFILVNR